MCEANCLYIVRYTFYDASCDNKFVFQYVVCYVKVQYFLVNNSELKFKSVQ